MTDNSPKACDLCSLPVETPDFTLLTLHGIKEFCCEGCQGIYQMLHEGEILGDGDAGLASGETGK
jgi:hypothetical protein